MVGLSVEVEVCIIVFKVIDVDYVFFVYWVEVDGLGMARLNSGYFSSYCYIGGFFCG